MIIISRNPDRPFLKESVSSPDVPSEKAAKDYKEAVQSIETSGKLGVWGTMLAYIQKITDFANDPRLKVVMDFLELFGTFLKAASSEDAQAIAELLYTEDNILFMKRLAESFKTTFEDTAGLNLSLLILDKTFKALGFSVDDFVKKLVDLIATFPRLGTDLGGTFVNAVKNGFIDALKNIDWEEIIKDIIEDHFD